jgi:hypothetical protein
VEIANYTCKRLIGNFTPLHGAEMHLKIINFRCPNCVHKKGKEAQAKIPAPLKRFMFPRFAVAPFEHPKGWSRRFL